MSFAIWLIEREERRGVGRRRDEMYHTQHKERGPMNGLGQTRMTTSTERRGRFMGDGVV